VEQQLREQQPREAADTRAAATWSSSYEQQPCTWSIRYGSSSHAVLQPRGASATWSSSHVEQQIREQQPRRAADTRAAATWSSRYGSSSHGSSYLWNIEPENSMTMQYSADVSSFIDLSIIHIEPLFVTHIEILIEPRNSEIHRLINVEP
jgi:hypothetical protein